MPLTKLDLIKTEYPDHLTFAFDGLTLKTDRFDRDGDDSVIGLGVNSGPHLLMNYLANNPHVVAGRRVFEPFAGAGPLGLVALKLGAAHVTLLDINPRAVAFLDENVRSNALDATRCELHVADLAAFEPREPFDVVLANPPFIPVPPGVRAPINSDGGADGNRFAEMLVRRLDALLAPGGEALMYALQLERDGRPLLAPALDSLRARRSECTRLLPRSIPFEVLRAELATKAKSKTEGIDAWARALVDAHGSALAVNWYIIHVRPTGTGPEILLRDYDEATYGPDFFPWRTLDDHALIRHTALSLIELDEDVYWLAPGVSVELDEDVYWLAPGVSGKSAHHPATAERGRHDPLRFASPLASVRTPLPARTSVVPGSSAG